MPPPLDPTKRAAILEQIREGKPRNEIARDLGVSGSSVSKIARENELAFDRTKTEKATRARALDSKAARSVEAVESLAVASDLRQRVLAARDGRDARDWATAYGIMSDKHMAFDRYDNDNGAEGARSMLGALAAGLQAAYDQMPATDES